MRLQSNDIYQFKELLKEFEFVFENTVQDSMIQDKTVTEKSLDDDFTGLLNKLFKEFEIVSEELESIRIDKTEDKKNRVRAAVLNEDVKVVKKMIHEIHEDFTGQEICTNAVDIDELLMLKR